MAETSPPRWRRPARRRARRQSEPSADAAVDADHRRERPHRRAGSQRRAHGVRPGRGLHARAVRRAVRRQRARHAARQPRRAAAHAQAEAGPAGLGVEQQLGRRHAALSRALLRGQGGDGRARRSVCRASCRAGASRPRSSCRAPSPRAPTTSRTPAARPTRRALAEYEAGPYKGFGEAGAEGVRRHRARRRRRRGRGRRHRRGRRHAVRQAAVPRPLRSHRRTAPMSASPCSTACAPKCCTVSAWPICSRPQSSCEHMTQQA